MMKRRLHSWVWCGVLVLAASGGGPGCADREKPAPAAEAKSAVVSKELIDPCHLVMKDEAESLMGVTFEPGQVTEQKVVGQMLCLYDEAGGDAMLQVALTQVAALPRGSSLTPEGLYRSIRDEGFPDAVGLEGIGEESFLAPPGVHVLHKGYYLTLSVGLLGSDRERRLKEAAAIAIGNLDRALRD